MRAARVPLGGHAPRLLEGQGALMSTAAREAAQAHCRFRLTVGSGSCQLAEWRVKSTEFSNRYFLGNTIPKLQIMRDSFVIWKKPDSTHCIESGSFQKMAHIYKSARCWSRSLDVKSTDAQLDDAQLDGRASFISQESADACSPAL